MFKQRIPVAFIFFLLLLAMGSCRPSRETSRVAKDGRETSKTEEKLKKESEYNLKEKYAGLLGISPKEVQNIKMYAFIEEWHGVPYKYGGKSKTGVDCSNFTSLLYAHAYGKQISGSSAGLFQMCSPVQKSNLKEGDLVFFKIDKGRISHVGIYLHNNKFVHATTKKGVMINDLDEPYYKKHFYKAGRLKN